MMKVFTQFFKTKHNTIMLGRWNPKNCLVKESISVFQANSDHCGDILCGDPNRYKEHTQFCKDTKSSTKKVKYLT